MMKRMMAHRNLRHRMNFIVLYGEVNQRKEVSGRLEVRPQRSAGHSCQAAFSKSNSHVAQAFHSPCPKTQPFAPTLPSPPSLCYSVTPPMLPCSSSWCHQAYTLGAQFSVTLSRHLLCCPLSFLTQDLITDLRFGSWAEPRGAVI